MKVDEYFITSTKMVEEFENSIRLTLLYGKHNKCTLQGSFNYDKTINNKESLIKRGFKILSTKKKDYDNLHGVTNCIHLQSIL